MKALIYLSVFVFSTIGGYIPTLFHQGFFSVAGIIGTIIGTVFGLWLAIRLRDYV